jgi:L-alanine-DL-glutamate epimerase-like enolase superfamily enzyme
MKITNIEIVRNKKPIMLPDSWRPAWNEPDVSPTDSLWFSFYKVYTDEGIVGIGPSGWGGTGLPSYAESSLIGQDPAYIERFWDINMKGREIILGSTSCGGLEIALWDIVGKAANMPVFKILGACRDKVMAYAATAQLKPAEEYAKMAVEFKAKGIKAMKLRLHRPKIEDDLNVVAAVRDAAKDMIILVDANQSNMSINYKYWSRRTALMVARELEKLDVYYLEEPLPRMDIEGLAELSAAVDIYIAGGEHCSNVYEFRDALFAKAYDIAQPDVILGNIGISGIKKVSVIADSVGRYVVPHVCGGGNNGLFLAATLQALGSVSNCPFIEYTLDPPALVPEVLHTILKEPIMIDPDGYVQIPQKPGIGVEINEDAIAEYL